MQILFFALVMLSPLPQEPASNERIVWSESTEAVTVVEGPIVLHADIFTQWGGHTFPYLLEGTRHVFWSGLESYEGPALLGSVPKPGLEGSAQIVRIPLEGPFSRVNPPQIVRTPDDHLHIFLTTRSVDDEAGDIHYWRTARAGEIGELVDRSDRMPRTRFDQFTIRQNVGVSRDGRRIVFCNLTDFVEGKHLMNLPLIWIGEREGEDFRFREPVVYGEQTSFFYPQVAATREGPVLLGAVHREPNRNAELVHLDWEGNVLRWLPFPGIQGKSWAFDMQPMDPDDWSRLAIARMLNPDEGSIRGIQFWTYNTKTGELELKDDLPNNLDREQSFASAGKFWMRPGRAPLFLNEPGSRQAVVWEGLYSNPRGPLRLTPLPDTNARAIGYPQIRSLFLPSQLQGSHTGEPHLFPMAMDLTSPGINRSNGDRCAWLLWWLRS